MASDGRDTIDWGPANDICAELLNLVRQMRPDIRWTAFSCATHQGEYWFRARVTQSEREFHFLLFVKDGNVIGASGMAMRLIVEADRRLQSPLG